MSHHYNINEMSIAEWAVRAPKNLRIDLLAQLKSRAAQYSEAVVELEKLIDDDVFAALDAAVVASAEEPKL